MSVTCHIRCTNKFQIDDGAPMSGRRALVHDRSSGLPMTNSSQASMRSLAQPMLASICMIVVAVAAISFIALDSASVIAAPKQRWGVTAMVYWLVPLSSFMFGWCEGVIHVRKNGEPDFPLFGVEASASTYVWNLALAAAGGISALAWLLSFNAEPGLREPVQTMMGACMTFGLLGAGGLGGLRVTMRHLPPARTTAHGTAPPQA